MDYPDIAVTRDGVSYIVWNQKDYEVSRWSMYFTSLSQNGNVLHDPDKLRRSFSDDYLFPSIDVDDDDNFHIAYLVDDPAQGMRVEYSKGDEDANFLEQVQMRDPTLGDPEIPSVSAFPNGDAAVFYAFPNPPNVGGSDLELQFLEFSNNTYHTIQVDRFDDEYFMTAVAAGNGAAGLVYIRDDDIRFRYMHSGNNPPVPLFTYSPENPIVDEVITFDASDSYDDDSFDYVSEYNFDWGDGTGTGWTSSEISTHSFSRADEYEVRLNVRDSEGLGSETAAITTVRVTEKNTNDPPTARLSVLPSTADIDEEVVFNGGSSIDPDGSVSEYNFDFGDGMSTGWITQSSVSHSYDSEAYYTASLMVRDDEGAESDPATVTITIVHVNEPPTATIISIEPDHIFEGDDVTLTGTGQDADGTIEAYSWESDLDGILGNTAVLTIDTLRIGAHTISFKVRDNEDVWSKTVTETLIVSLNQDFALEDRTSKREVRTDGEMHFGVIYTDIENDPPTMFNLLYAKGNVWKEVRLEEADPADQDFTDGKEYDLVKEFGVGAWKYAFEFENEKNLRKTTDVLEFEVLAESAFPIPAIGLLPMLLAMLIVALTTVLRRRN